MLRGSITLLSYRDLKSIGGEYLRWREKQLPSLASKRNFCLQQSRPMVYVLLLAYQNEYHGPRA